MTHPLVVVYTAAGQTDAHIIKGMLEAAGIPAVISQEGAGAAYGFTVGMLGMVDVLVTGKDAAEAEALIAAMQRGELEDETQNPNDPISSADSNSSDEEADDD
jgi:hypothetical protein